MRETPKALATESGNTASDVTMGNPQESSLNWLACAIDCEGSVSFQVYTQPNGKIRITPYVCLVNTDEGILTKAWRILSELTATSRFARPRWCNHNGRSANSFISRLDCKTIRVDGTAVRFILEPLLPYFVSAKKRKAASAILQYLALRDTQLLKRDGLGRITRQGYTEEQISLVTSTRSHPGAKSPEAIRSAPNVLRAAG